jgi:hypothetical protein
MKHKISAILMLSLMLSMLLMPMAVSADTGKSIIKEMVQAPTDYSVGGGGSPYYIPGLERMVQTGYEMSRFFVYNQWVFVRIS